MFSSESVYWVYSTAAQVLSAMLGLLLAGYALMYSMMETKAEDDEMLQELNDKLQKGYYRQLTALAVVTAASIIFDIAVLYLNKSNHPASSLIQIIAIPLMLASMIQAMSFIITIADPKKYQKAAERILDSDDPMLSVEDVIEDDGDDGEVPATDQIPASDPVARPDKVAAPSSELVPPERKTDEPSMKQSKRPLEKTAEHNHPTHRHPQDKIPVSGFTRIYDDIALLVQRIWSTHGDEEALKAYQHRMGNRRGGDVFVGMVQVLGKDKVLPPDVYRNIFMIIRTQALISFGKSKRIRARDVELAQKTKSQLEDLVRVLP